MVVISMLGAPPSAAQTLPVQPVPPARLRLDLVDEQIMEALSLAGRYGLPVWSLLDRAASTQHPSSRAERRALRLDAWHRLKRLVNGGHVHWFGRKIVSKYNLPRISVRRRRRSRRGSTFERDLIPEEQTPAESLSANLFVEPQGRQAPAEAKAKTESAKTTDGQTRQDEIRCAAQTLAALPRGAKRKLSGFIGDTRIWRDRPILLPDGTSAFAYGARRQMVVYFRDAERRLEFGRWGVLPASQIQLQKNKAAVVLGRAKAGVKEKPSDRKKEACRMNACRPCRAGLRRGRPRRVGV